MPVDGLRAWIGEVERKLGMRTRVFLVLAALAVGVGGAAIYLALDVRSDAVTESDVRELQERLEGGVGVGGVGADTAQLEAELRALQAEVEELRRGQGGGGAQGGGQGGAGQGGGAGTGGAGAEPQDLLEEARRRSQGGD